MSDQRQFLYLAPESIALDPDLSLCDLRLYMIIRSFQDTHKACFARNSWLAEKLHVDERTIRVSISNLCEKNYILRETINGQRFLSIAVQKLIYIDNDDLSNGRISKSPPPDLEILPPPDLEIRHTISNNTLTKNTICERSNYESKTEIVDNSSHKGFFPEYKKQELDGLEVASWDVRVKQCAIACLANIKCKELFESKFKGRDVTLEDIHAQCVEYYALQAKPQLVGEQRFLGWLKRDKAEKYTLIGNSHWRPATKESEERDRLAKQVQYQEDAQAYRSTVGEALKRPALSPTAVSALESLKSLVKGFKLSDIRFNDFEAEMTRT